MADEVRRRKEAEQSAFAQQHVDAQHTWAEVCSVIDSLTSEVAQACTDLRMKRSKVGRAYSVMTHRGWIFTVAGRGADTTPRMRLVFFPDGSWSLLGSRVTTDFRAIGDLIVDRAGTASLDRGRGTLEKGSVRGEFVTGLSRDAIRDQLLAQMR